MCSMQKHEPSCLGTLDLGGLRAVSSHLALTCCDAKFRLWKIFLYIMYIKITNLQVTWCNLKWKYRDTFSGAVSSRQPAGFTGFTLIILHQVKTWPILVALPTLNVMF